MFMVFLHINKNPKKIYYNIYDKITDNKNNFIEKYKIDLYFAINILYK